MPFHLAPRFVHDVVTAGRLEKAWRARFRFDYFMIDEIRISHLVARLRLREQPRPYKHTALPSPLAVGEPDPTRPEVVRFKPGGWWPDMTCARLDGIVGTERETTSRGDDHTPTLPLLTGREMNIGHSRVRYFREGTLANMHPLLMSQTDKHIRVLRGHQLRSHFAPVAGIRNDGLWRVLKYSERHLETTGFYRLEVMLEKVEGEVAMSELMRVPRPSHLDEWDLYNRLKSDREGRVNWD